MAKAVGIIPSRYASSRFPGKPLVDILGKSMIERVYAQATRAARLSRVVVATDDQRIADHVKTFGGEVVMTSPHHVSGTERCAETVGLLKEDFDVVVNIQGDEPFIEPAQIDLLVGMFDNPETHIGTLIKKTDNAEDLQSDTVIKVVCDLQNRAMYFSRNPIPHVRGAEQAVGDTAFFKHIGIYAYRSEVLQKLAVLPMTALEKAESLEQLRWLEHGHTIHLAETFHESNSVDTPEDLQRMLREMKGHSAG